MEDNTPRVLVISHTVFSATGNMGKTMMRMLAGIPPDRLAQLYFHQEIPTRRCCLRYFRITDSEVLRSVFTRRAGGRSFNGDDIDEAADSRVDCGNLAKVYQFSRRRTPLIYFLRNSMWAAGKWKSSALLEWAESFHPDVIFFAAGDYAFSYRVTLSLAQYLQVPVVMWCADDYYLSPPVSPFRRLQCRRLRKLARQVVRQSGAVVTISDKMGTDYARFFDVPVETVRISSDPNPYALPATQRTGIVYAGNLGLNRIAPLVELGRALRQAALPGFSAIDVYSGEQRPAVLRQITEENGLHYCGRISASEVERLLGRSKFLVFTESFDDKSVRRVKYSLSTKISESLRSGACLLAYGSPQIASIEYLHRHNAARILRSADELPAALLELCSSHDTYAKYVRAAQELAEQCHNQERNDFLMCRIFRNAIENAASGQENLEK
mgnify:FL=1